MDANLVKELRDKTNAGMMDCKKALLQSNGDFEKAIEFLRKQGIATASKKASRQAKEGKVTVLINGKSAIVVEVNCETDFVARNENFSKLVQEVATKLLNATSNQVKEKEIIDSSFKKFLDDLITDSIAKIGENIFVKRFYKIENAAGLLGSYIHLGGKIGVLVEIKPKDNQNIDVILKDIGMHIAASSPDYINSKEVPAAILDKEKEIIKSQITGKPEPVVEKIVMGKLNKFYEEKCLVDQIFVKDQDKKVKDILAGAEVIRFVRFQVGE